MRVTRLQLVPRPRKRLHGTVLSQSRGQLLSCICRRCPISYIRVYELEQAITRINRFDSAHYMHNVRSEKRCTHQAGCICDISSSSEISSTRHITLSAVSCVLGLCPLTLRLVRAGARSGTPLLRAGRHITRRKPHICRYVTCFDLEPNK